MTIRGGRRLVATLLLGATIAAYAAKADVASSSCHRPPRHPSSSSSSSSSSVASDIHRVPAAKTTTTTMTTRARASFRRNERNTNNDDDDDDRRYRRIRRGIADGIHASATSVVVRRRGRGWDGVRGGGGGGGSTPPSMHAAIDNVRRGGGGNAILNRTSLSTAALPSPLPATPTSSFVATMGSAARGGPTSIARVASFASSLAFRVGCVLAVSSGCLGACVASWIVGVVRYRIVPIIADASSCASSSSSSSWRDGEYRWTALATALSLLLPPPHCPFPSSSSRRRHRLDDLPYLVMLWSYSHLVDPTFGGVLGIVHAFLGMSSNILGNAWMGNVVGRLGDDRYATLDDDVAYVDPTRCIRASREPILLTDGRGRRRGGGHIGLGDNGKIPARMASGMASASLLVAFPQHFLGLYMLGTALASSLGPYLDGVKRDGGILRRTVGAWSRWWLLGEARTGAGGVVGEGGAGDAILPWRLSKRLLVLYWVITLSKAVVAYMVM